MRQLYVSSREKQVSILRIFCRTCRARCSRKSSHKGPQMKITNTFLKDFNPYLEEWKSLPATHVMFTRDHPNIAAPALRTLYYHASDCMCLNKAFEAVYRAYKKRKPKKDLEVAKNHKPEQTIETLPPELNLTNRKDIFKWI